MMDLMRYGLCVLPTLPTIILVEKHKLPLNSSGFSFAVVIIQPFETICRLLKTFSMPSPNLEALTKVRIWISSRLRSCNSIYRKSRDLTILSTPETIKSYIRDLETELADLRGDDVHPMDDMGADDLGSEPPFPPLYSSGDDTDKAGDLKMQASDKKSENKWDEALELYTAAVLCAEPSSLLYANRAFCLLQLERPRAAERDCTEALKQNPDSAKALRIRGKARLFLENWEGARADLSQSQAIDFDQEAVEDLNVALEKCKELEAAKTEERLHKEEKLRKRAEEIKQAKEDAKKRDTSSARAAPGGMGGMPGGMPGGMGGIPGGMNGIMEALASDPELAAAMQNPKVIAAFSSLMSGGPAGLMANPAKMQELMSDPEVGPIMMKLMSKMGMGGMPGGMPGGMGGGNGMDDEDLEDMPDLDDLPDLD
jgi:suppressor of tumorigenicity protein 13